MLHDLKVKSIRCPNCQKSSSMEDSNPSRPFCCERCKLIDLGNWASEEYAIPTEEKMQDPGPLD